MVLWPTNGVTAGTGTALSKYALQQAVEGFGSSAEEIFAQSEWHLGYIPRTEAAILAPKMDSMELTELDGELTFAATGGAQISYWVPE